ncbi:sulfotransferase [Mesorhizobium sp.]|uniref:sulfotransferase family protein n=1 Tax=Mesorhizobium sp. TaxID=1871066 RepID=UPI000FE558DC|nr:sulfotransferase [Mesorhizobium sp.]RWE55629.1 MAG: sulfotransferase [Mesorhizobium sp.]
MQHTLNTLPPSSIAIDGCRALPDFIIGGAPKCGTTTLHFILDQHPEIRLPGSEIHYFDADDPVTHPDFFSISGERLLWKDPRPENATGLDWYQSRFRPFAGNGLIGEDSTTYLFSEVAAARIRALLPSVRMIFMLRHPVNRAYSQYWHLIESGRTALTFEKAITRQPSIILGSTYVSGLRRFFDQFPREQIKVVLFEELTGNTQVAVDEVTEYLGVEHLPVSQLDTWFNKTTHTSAPALQRGANLIAQYLVSGRYRGHMTSGPTSGAGFGSRLGLRYTRLVRRLLPKTKNSPKMRSETRAFLTQHLSARNEGLSDLVGRDVSSVWTDMQI